MKVHKDHYDRKEEFIGYCKGLFLSYMVILSSNCRCRSIVNRDAHSAKELLILATTIDEQKKWVKGLQAKISRKGIPAISANSSMSEKSNSLVILHVYLHIQILISNTNRT